MEELRRLKISNSLSFRLFILILFLSVTILTIYTYVSIRLQTDNLMDTVLGNAQRTVDILKKSTRYSMLLNRREDSYEIMRTIGSEPGVEAIRLYNKRGEITFSSIPSEKNKIVDVSAEACYVCHNPENPFSAPSNNKKSRIYQSSKGYRVFGLIEPIKNETDCSNADCHAHPPEKTVIGVLDVKLSLENLDDSVEISKNRLILLSSIVIFLILLIYLALIRTVIHKPVKKLYYGIREISKGNLDFRIDIKSQNELGLLAKAINTMSGDLKRALDEIKDWSNTLEKKVDDKTKELKKIQSQIIQIEKMTSLGKLSATVAHEINNPLAGVLNYTKLIIRRLNNPELSQELIERSKEDLKIVSDEIVRLGNIVRNLLLFSKRKDIDFTTDNLYSIIESALMLVNHHLAVNNIKLIKEFEKKESEIYCDPQQIKQLLLALFINAVEAMNDGGTLTVSVFYIEAERMYEIKISDSGVGISEEDLSHIFEPFFTTKVNGKGVGLGLSVAYGIIERHNGLVEVHSEKNQGTTFAIRLPKSEKTK
jgi:two-component system, NtrC family, sensor kinase